jgi:putative acetyltransferase
MVNREQIKIMIAHSEQDFSDSREIILEYAASLGIDLAFQNFDDEMKNLEQMYTAPYGGIVLASVNGKTVGVAGIRKFNDEACELKRMFIRPDFRGFGIGQLLLDRSIRLAKTLNYTQVLLDTYDSMKAAISLYTQYGFVEIAAYRHNPHTSAKYFELKLDLR